MTWPEHEKTYLKLFCDDIPQKDFWLYECKDYSEAWNCVDNHRKDEQFYGPSLDIMKCNSNGKYYIIVV